MDTDKPRRKYWKFVAAFLAMIFLAFGVVIALRVHEINKLAKEQAEKAIKLVEQLKREQEAFYQKQLADTYGGKTPQETLQMYIDAVEKGDYELASKYFVVEKQEKELRSFDEASAAKVQNYLLLLKKSINETGGYYPRDYMVGGKEFIIDKPIYVRMQIYPSGVWKIIEI
jgi:hypothetical protein